MKKTLLLSLYVSGIMTTILYGDALSKSMDFLNDDKKYDSLESYGIVSAGIEGTTINVLSDDIEVEDGIMKKLDVHLYGYSIYSKSSSNYLDFKFITPYWETDNFGDNRLATQYKSLDYNNGASNGKIESLMIALNSNMEGALELDLLRLDYTKMSQDNINNYSNYYLVGFGGRLPSVEDELIAKIARRGKLPYDVKFQFFEKAGLYVGYGWANGENPNALFQSTNDNSKDSKSKGFAVYTYEMNPSMFLTFPLGYVKLQYQYRFSIAQAMTTNGFNASLAIIF